MQRDVVLARQGEQLRPLFGEEFLVGSDHVLARGQSRLHQRAGCLHPANDLDHDANLGVVQYLARIIRQQLGR